MTIEYSATANQHGTNTMYQPNLQHILAKSALPRTVQDYNAALTSASSFLAEIERAHANPLPGDPLAKSTFSQSSSPTSGLTYYDLETGAKFVYPLLTPLRNEMPRVSGKGGIQANWRAVTGVNIDRVAHRRVGRQPRRHPSGFDPGLQRRLQGHRHRNLGRLRGAICRHGF